MGIGTEQASGAAAAFFRLLSGRNAMIGLAPLGFVAGMAMLWVFRRTSNPQAIGRAKARMAAHLYEMRLFPDEPALIWRAQAGLLRANVRYLGLMLIPALVMSLPMAALVSELECFYGRRPLEPGRDAILTVQLKTGSAAAAPVIRVPEGIAVETGGVRVDGGRQISWRIRAARPASGKLAIVFPGETVEKSVDAGDGPRYLSTRRVSSMRDFLWHPAERLLTSSAVEWVEVRYAAASVSAFGLELPWLAWFLLFSAVAAVLLKRRFGVTF
jgi:hypothetical protein